MHNVYLFIAHAEVLRPYAETSAIARFYRLTPGAELLVLPLDDDVLDDLHRRYGTGEWLDSLRLTTADMGFAAETSRRGPLGYVQTDYAGGVGIQAAALWAGGALAIRPLSMTSEHSVGRPRATWPINAVLRELGVAASSTYDAFDTFGLGAYRSHDGIAERALPGRH